MDERFGESKVPKISLIDFKEAQNLKTTNGSFTIQMIMEIREQLEQKKQVIILHNRRGYANVIECESCGYTQYCSNCDVVMTYHKVSNELKCHYCGQRSAVPKQCPSCNSENLTTKVWESSNWKKKFNVCFRKRKLAEWIWMLCGLNLLTKSSLRG